MTFSPPALAEPSALVNAGLWIQHIFTGPFASGLAAIAVAGMGLMMLDGRIDVRRGGRVLLGCFLIFGAANIANGLRSLADEELASTDSTSLYAQTPDDPKPPLKPAAPHDPYAGASVNW